MSKGLRKIRVADCDLSWDLKQRLIAAYGQGVTMFRLHRIDRDELQRKTGCDREAARELGRAIRIATKVVNAERDRRRAQSAQAPKCHCGNHARAGETTCGRHTPDEELAAEIADDFEKLAAYRRLHDGLSEMIENGRLTRAAIPDDYDWLCDSLEKLS